MISTLSALDIYSREWHPHNWDVAALIKVPLQTFTWHQSLCVLFVSHQHSCNYISGGRLCAALYGGVTQWLLWNHCWRLRELERRREWQTHKYFTHNQKHDCKDKECVKWAVQHTQWDVFWCLMLLLWDLWKHKFLMHTHNRAYYSLRLDVFYVRDLQAIPGGQFSPWG